MAEINRRGLGDVFGLKLALICGPVEGDPYTDTQLERAWEVYGEELTEDLRHHPRPGQRPWGWWKFVAGVEEPADRADGIPIIHELGELTESERLRIAERAVEARAARDRGDAYNADDIAAADGGFGR